VISSLTIATVAFLAVCGTYIINEAGTTRNPAAVTAATAAMLIWLNVTQCGGVAVIMAVDIAVSIVVVALVWWHTTQPVSDTTGEAGRCVSLLADDAGSPRHTDNRQTVQPAVVDNEPVGPPIHEVAAVTSTRVELCENCQQPAAEIRSVQYAIGDGNTVIQRLCGQCAALVPSDTVVVLETPTLSSTESLGATTVVAEAVESMEVPVS